jgi:hypothetical protein
VTTTTASAMIKPGLSIIEMVTDSDEGSYLQAVFAAPHPHAALVEYANHLHGRDDLRSEFLRLEGLLAGPEPLGEHHRALQARYAELLAVLEPFGFWLQLVRRGNRLLNCGRTRTELPVVRFSFQCPKQWEELAPTAEPGVRVCADCEENVHYCEDSASAELHARRGDCIAVPVRTANDAAGHLAHNMVGRPDVYQLWGEELFRG